MFCGGAFMQWEENGGKCGICGEDWSLPRKYEKGGRLYKGNIMKTYKKGQFIVAVVEVDKIIASKLIFEALDFLLHKNNNRY